MKYQKHFALFVIVFVSVLGGYLLSYANFSQKIPQNLIGKNEVYAKEDSNNLAVSNPNFSQIQKIFRAVPAKVLPSVVQINVSSVEETSVAQNPFFRFFGQPDEGENIPKQQYRRAGLGSGSIMKKKGNTYYVLTNNHVVENAEDIEITTYNGEKFPAEIVGHDGRVDLAVIKFESDNGLPDMAVADLGDSSQMAIGDMVMAVGSPDGLQSTVTQGIISYIGRRGGPGGNINDFIQTDASINRGNSGGPLVNMNGEIIGINTWIASESGSSAGLGFAIPINNVRFVIDSFLTDGKLSYGWLGVTVPRFQELVGQFGREVSKEVFEPMGIYGLEGSFISAVDSGSPAAKAGIQAGDFVVELNGEPIKSSDELTFVVGMLRPKQKVALRLIRNGKEQEITVVLGERKTDEELAKDRKNNWPGIQVLPLSKEINAKLKAFSNGRMGSEETSGLLIVSSTPDSATQVVGIQEGDVIIEINGEKVANLAEFYRELNKSSAKNTTFTYKRKGYELETPKIREK